MNLDSSLFPDVAEPPQTLPTDADKADYVARVCGAWDFGLVPTAETFGLFRSWRDVFDRFPISSSPSYTAFRMLYGWPTVDSGQLQIAGYERIDARQRDFPDSFADCT
jgi:hypothetical protein